MDEETEYEKKDANETFGFDLYPERRAPRKIPTFYEKLTWEHRFKSTDRRRCEYNVLKAIENNPVVKILIGALKKHGCPVNVKRHIVCESCDTSVTGGYDLEFNQIVVCDNTWKGREMVQTTLAHELIHMYDYCLGNLDFKNLEHLACTEIRAANLAHCSYLSSVVISQSSLFNIKKTHQDCVKMKAAQSMIMTRNIDLETAMKYISKVFDKCYSDLEPIGRRIRRNSWDQDMAYDEAVHLNFC